MSESSSCFILAMFPLLMMVQLILNDPKDVPLREDLDAKQKKSVVLFVHIMIAVNAFFAILAITVGIIMRLGVI